MPSIKLMVDLNQVYGTQLVKMGIEQLCERRETLVEKLSRQRFPVVSSPLFSSKWLPVKEPITNNTRHEQIYIEYKCASIPNATDRFMAKRMN